MNEQLIETRVRYVLEMNGTLLVVENVPARVNEETGEQFFAPETVERLQSTLASSPVRYVEARVYDFAA